MTNCKPGDVVLVQFPFTNLKSEKKRPALVLATRSSRGPASRGGSSSETRRSPAIHLVTIAMITSQVEMITLPGDVLLEQWESAGLLHPSLARLSKVATLDHELIERVLGRIRSHDMSALRKAFARQFDPWIA